RFPYRPDNTQTGPRAGVVCTLVLPTPHPPPGGGPPPTTEILNIFIYRTFGQGLFAQATTMSLVLFLLVALMAFPVIYVLRKREEIL
ncbi:hypothetical protein ACWDX9_49010, partial [Nonomuraea sp. NPDC003201]